MTKQQSGDGHDPFAYGQVQLGSDDVSNNSEPSPDQMLFEVGESTEQVFGNEDPAQPEDWELLQSDIQDLLPGGAPAPGGPQLPPPEAPTGIGQAPVPAAEPVAPEPRHQPQPTESNLHRPSTPRARPQVPQQQLPARRPVGVATSIVPMLVLVAGAGVGAYSYLIADNVVLAGIAGALGLIGTAFSWVLLRR